MLEVVLRGIVELRTGAYKEATAKQFHNKGSNPRSLLLGKVVNPSKILNPAFSHSSMVMFRKEHGAAKPGWRGA